MRLAANCFEQNMIAVPVTNFADPLLLTSTEYIPPRFNSGTSQIRIVLRSIRPIAQGEELAFWPSFDLNLALGIPFLSLSNIVNGTCYACTDCGKSYTQPNPLKIHLKFACPMAQTSLSLSTLLSSPPILTSTKSSQFVLSNGGPTKNTSSFSENKLFRVNPSNNMATSHQHLLPLVNFASSCHRTGKLSKKAHHIKTSRHGLDGHRKLHSCTYCGM